LVGGQQQQQQQARGQANNPPVIEIYILKHFLNSWLHNHFLHFQV
jgi:hypothetical protein